MLQIYGEVAIGILRMNLSPSSATSNVSSDIFGIGVILQLVIEKMALEALKMVKFMPIN